MLRYLLAAAALLITLAFWPYWEGGGITPRWAVLAVMGACCLTAASEIRMTRAHWIGAAFLAYATLSLLWTPVETDGIGAMFKLAFMALVFMAASECDDIGPAYAALGLGVTVSAAIAVTQALGEPWVPVLVGPAGLFVNKNYLSEIAVVTLVLTAGRGWWVLVPGPAVALLLSHSRGSLVALAAVAVVWCLPRSRALAGAVAGVCVACGIVSLSLTLGPKELHDESSLVHRLGVWTPTLRHLTPFGYGIGSFYVTYPTFNPHPVLALTRPEHAHNEVINVASELGVPGLVLFLAFFGYAAWTAAETERLAIVAIMVVGMFSFPLHLPATGFVAALVAGWSTRRLRRVRRTDLYGGAERAARLSNG